MEELHSRWGVTVAGAFGEIAGPPINGSSADWLKFNNEDWGR